MVQLDEGRAGKPASAAAAAARWFAQDLFDDPNLIAEDDVAAELPALRPSGMLS